MEKGNDRTGRGLTGFEAGMLIVLQSLVYGFGDPISKIAFEIVPVYSMMTVRYTIAFVFCIAIFGKRIVRTVKTVPVKAWLIPGICIALSYVLNNIALNMTEATSVAFLRSLAVVMTPALAFIAYKKRYRWQQIAASGPCGGYTSVYRQISGSGRSCIHDCAPGRMLGGDRFCRKPSGGRRSPRRLCYSKGMAHNPVSGDPVHIPRISAAEPRSNKDK